MPTLPQDLVSQGQTELAQRLCSRIPVLDLRPRPYLGPRLNSDPAHRLSSNPDQSEPKLWPHIEP